MKNIQCIGSIKKEAINLSHGVNNNNETQTLTTTFIKGFIMMVGWGGYEDGMGSTLGKLVERG